MWEDWCKHVDEHSHICITKKAFSGVIKHARYDLMNGMLLLRRENQWYHMLIPIPNSTYWNTQQPRLKSKGCNGAKGIG